MNNITNKGTKMKTSKHHLAWRMWNAYDRLILLGKYEVAWTLEVKWRKWADRN